MKIDLSNGSVRFERGTIGPGMDRPSFLHSELGNGAELYIDNEPHITYGIRPEAGVAATVYFHGDRLKGITWLQELPQDKEREWTEKLELERKELHDDWLVRELGEPPYRYTWGEISSEYDPKGCVSDIILNYGC